MKYKAVSIRDRQANAFAPPFFVATLGQAIRSFSDEINRPAENNQLYRHPDDFDLYDVGVYDDETGTFMAETTPLQICVGKNVAVREK